MLYPKLNRSRMLFDLGGVWDFQTAGAKDWPLQWADGPLPEPMTMAVPASYNDQKDDVNLRSHYGWAVYQRTFTVPARVIAAGERVWLRGIAGEIEIELEGKGDDAQPRPQGGELVRRGGQIHVPQGAEGVGQQHLFGRADDEPLHAGGELLKAVAAVGELLV